MFVCDLPPPFGSTTLLPPLVQRVLHSLIFRCSIPTQRRNATRNLGALMHACLSSVPSLQQNRPRPPCPLTPAPPPKHLRRGQRGPPFLQPVLLPASPSPLPQHPPQPLPVHLGELSCRAWRARYEPGTAQGKRPLRSGWPPHEVIQSPDNESLATR